MNNSHAIARLSFGAISRGGLTLAVFAVLLAVLTLVFDRLFPPLSWPQALLAWAMLSVIMVFGPMSLRGLVLYLRGIRAAR